MAVNPMELMKLRERLSVFQSQHPRFSAFMTDVAANALMEGSVLEIKAARPDGKEYVTNLRLTREDMETIEILKHLK